MLFPELIVAKRDGKALSTDQITNAIKGYVSGKVPDYQMSALLMAMFLRGLSTREMRDLTRAMIDSGDVFDLSGIPGVKVDKHSTGGVGDKISIPLAPLVAAAGGIVPMVAGRGLGHTGGTIDKLESIPGFKTRLSQRQFIRQLSQIGCVIAGQNERLVPADRKLYALRDVTGTVESIPLIAASILSKKIASGNDALVMDVKVGSGAFMPTAAKSRELAETLVQLSGALGLRVVAYLSDMSQPLGRAIGNSLEISESIKILQGNGPSDVVDLTIDLGARMLLLGNLATTMADAREVLRRVLSRGEGFERFLAMVKAQGGDPNSVEKVGRLNIAPLQGHLQAEGAGYLQKIDTRAIGLSAVGLGAGRRTLHDKIDHGVGFVMLKKLGERLEKDEPIIAIHARTKKAAEMAVEQLQKAIVIGDQAIKAPKLIKGMVVE